MLVQQEAFHRPEHEAPVRFHGDVEMEVAVLMLLLENAHTLDDKRSRAGTLRAIQCRGEGFSHHGPRQISWRFQADTTLRNLAARVWERHQVNLLALDGVLVPEIFDRTWGGPRIRRLGP